MRRKISRYFLTVFYLIAGVNHFIHPEFYLGLIPSYLPSHYEINILAGLAEIILGTGILWVKTRKLSATIIVIMLLLFIPSHVYFLQIGCCVSDSLCTPCWVGWIRLLVIHPILIIWAWIHRN